MYKATVYKCVKKEKGVMESVGRKRKCLSRKNHLKPHKQSTQFKVSQTKFARLLS